MRCEKGLRILMEQTCILMLRIIVSIRGENVSIKYLHSALIFCVIGVAFPNKSIVK